MRRRNLRFALYSCLLAVAAGCPADDVEPQPDPGSSSGEATTMAPPATMTSTTAEPGDGSSSSTTGDATEGSGSSSGAADSSTSGADSSSGGSTTGVEPMCGNGVVEGDEECDSVAPSATCDDDCTMAECGDGTVNAVAGETCDDGNGSNDDPCPDGPGGSCRAAECSDGFLCTDPACTSGATGGTEDCDDGNAAEGDGCSDLCRIEGDGCADGLREGFIDGAANTLIAGCSGGFDVPGVATAAACGNAAGDDSANPLGTGCSVADLCAPGWHVCESPAEVTASSATGCTNVTVVGDDPLFFVAQISGSGGGLCDGLGSNDIFGCGNLGAAPNQPSCDPLNRFSQDSCFTLGADWDCGSANFFEALNVIKPSVDAGGALCCID